MSIVEPANLQELAGIKSEAENLSNRQEELAQQVAGIVGETLDDDGQGHSLDFIMQGPTYDVETLLRQIANPVRRTVRPPLTNGELLTYGVSNELIKLMGGYFVSGGTVFDLSFDHFGFVHMSPTARTTLQKLVDDHRQKAQATS